MPYVHGIRGQILKRRMWNFKGKKQLASHFEFVIMRFSIKLGPTVQPSRCLGLPVSTASASTPASCLASTAGFGAE